MIKLNRNLLIFVVLIIIVYTVIIVLASCTPSGTEANVSRKPKVLVLVKSSGSKFWQTVFAGAKVAANEYNIDLQLSAPESEKDYETQNEMMEKAIEDKVDAIVFSACDFDNSVEVAERAIDSGIPIIIIDSQINTDKVLCTIGTDNVEAGRMAGRTLIEYMNGKAKVGVINFEKGSANAMQREQGFIESMKGYNEMVIADIRYSYSNAESPKKATIDMLRDHPDINAIATFNEWTTIGVANAIDELGLKDQITVVGFDNNPESIKMLEDGVIDALIVQNPFAMGYLGVQYAIQAIKNKNNFEDVDTGTVVINRENMYNIENQKLLFPFSYSKDKKED
ncbi:MAG TPA: substrate-binding domain-containing protein [Clostridiaceae bacterium]|nr:substrate-binding domain-containing protein [Clostridiaceae bacterium]